MKKKIWISIIVVLILLAVTAGIVFANSNVNLKEWGKLLSGNSQKEEITTESIANVNDKPISKDKFENYKISLSYASGDFSDEEILDKLITQEVIMQEIERRGITVTEQEINTFNDERFALMEQDPSLYEITKDFVDGKGITMEEYKEESKEISRQALLANKLRDEMVVEYQDKSSDDKSAPSQQDFQEYFNNYISDLKEEATIEIVE